MKRVIQLLHLEQLAPNIPFKAVNLERPRWGLPPVASGLVYRPVPRQKQPVR